MNKLPKPKRLPPVPDSQRRYLAQWLAMRRFEQAWEIPPVAEASGGERPAAAPATDGWTPLAHAPFDAKVEIGDVRLLPGEMTDDRRFPCYVAVVDTWDFGLYLAVPFAPYSVPATTGELAIGREHFSLAVLQCWNAVVAPVKVLSRSWLADRLDAAELADALAGFRHIVSGTPLPERFAERIGPPILLPDDPRIAYQAEETEALAPLRAACEAESAAVAETQTAGLDTASILPADSSPRSTTARRRGRGPTRFPRVTRPPWSVFSRRFEEMPELLAAANGWKFIPCLVTRLGEHDAIEESAPPAVLWAEARNSFESMRPGEEFCNKWFVKTSLAADPFAALVYFEGREKALGNAMVCAEPGGFFVTLDEIDLAPDEQAIVDPDRLRLVILLT